MFFSCFEQIFCNSSHHLQRWENSCLFHVKALNEAGIHAGYINSSLTEGQISKVYSRTLEGGFKILYVAPERLESNVFFYFQYRIS